MSVFIGYPSFMAYQMMKGKKGNNDGFPSIPGMIARYSALGLTNEQMAENLVWKDLTGNGHDLQMKNFAWGGMSGVGGYTENYNSNKWYKVGPRIDVTWTYKSFNARSIKDNRLAQLFYQSSLSDTGFRVLSCTIKVSGLTDGQGIEYVSNGTQQFVIMRIENDGIYHLPSFDFGAKNAYYGFKFLKLQESCNITIEQLPLYPGFILGDGVDDFAVTENNLDLEDTYTIYTPLILLKYGGVVCGKNSDKDFSLNTVISSKSIGFDSANAWSGSIPVDLFEFVLVACKRSPQTMYVKDLVTGKSNQNKSKEFVPNPRKYFVWRNVGGSWCQVAIAGQIICNGYYSTDEDDEKVLDWYKKQYPWLFFDQAWTVVGKTNEDEDRATIANITGNGNDLVLSNFGFAEGSGYGLYGFKFFSKAGIEYYSGSKISFSKHQLDQITLIPYILVYPGTSYPREKDITAKIKVAGLKEGVSLTWGWAGNTELTITEDGTYSISAGSGKLRQLDVVYAEGFDPDHVVTIEQIPEYEGYLVTDGVDDKIVSAKSIAFTDTWTIITDAIFLGEKVVSAGILVKDIFGVSNLMEYGRVEVSVKGGVLLKVPTPSIKAICSDGRIYDADWNEYQAEPGTIKVSEGKLYIGMWYNGMQFCSIAFKNIATYNGYALSKDDCIKAYNYLQTLKAK